MSGKWLSPLNVATGIRGKGSPGQNESNNLTFIHASREPATSEASAIEQRRKHLLNIGTLAAHVKLQPSVPA